MKISLTREQRIRIANSRDIYSIMKQVLLRENRLDKGKEHFWIVGLASSNKISFIELVHLGTFAASPAGPNEIFEVSVLKKAVRIIMVHNHPSGTLEPSPEDEDVTDRLIQAGRLLNIDVIDHLIITPKSYFSFADTGLLKILKLESKYEPGYMKQARIEKEANCKTARKMLEKGTEVAFIMETTGLTAEEIEEVRQDMMKKEDLRKATWKGERYGE